MRWVPIVIDITKLSHHLARMLGAAGAARAHIGMPPFALTCVCACGHKTLPDISILFLANAARSCGIKGFHGAEADGARCFTTTMPRSIAIIARFSRRAAFHAEDEERLKARMHLRKPGDPVDASHLARRRRRR